MEPSRSEAEHERRIRFALKYLRQGDRVGTGLLILLLLTFLAQAWTLPFGTFDAPGSGMWPTLIGVISVTIGLTLFWINRQIPAFLFRNGVWKPALTVSSIAFVPLSYDIIGFIPATAVSSFVLLKIVGNEKTLLSGGLAITTSFVVYGIFSLALGLPITGVEFL